MQYNRPTPQMHKYTALAAQGLISLEKVFNYMLTNSCVPWQCMCFKFIKHEFAASS